MTGTNGAAKSPHSNAAGGAFAALFAGLHGTASSTSTAPLGVDGALERSIKEQLDRGTSLDDIVARLASSLAASVANQLGISTRTAHEQLTQAFSTALQPTGSGPPQTNAERASTLVSRLRQIAELATRVTNGDTGQPIRLIAGQRSDAEQAKATPPLQPDITGNAGDGKTVALPNGTQPIATGGDTPLGRILARALLAVNQTAPVSPPATSSSGPNPSSDSSLTTSVILSSSKGASQPLLALRQGFETPQPDIAQDDAVRGGHTNSSATALGAAASPTSAASSNAAVLDAFVTAFASALAREDAASTQRDSAKPPVAVSTDSGATAISYAIPFLKDQVPVAQSAPATALPQPQHVDANAVVDQILRGVAIRTSDGQSEVRLRLVPESLGDVSVKLVVSGGSVDASITAHTADAQNALAGAQSQLAKTFADAGLKLQSFTVALAGGGFADSRDPSRQNDASTQSNVRRIGGIDALGPDEPEDALLAIPSFGPPIYAARLLPGTLNHLA